MERNQKLRIKRQKQRNFILEKIFHLNPNTSTIVPSIGNSKFAVVSEENQNNYVNDNDCEFESKIDAPHPLDNHLYIEENL